MKAAVVEEAGRLSIRELPEPSFGEYQARCRLMYGTLCAGTDGHLLRGDPPFCYWTKRPFVIGHESVGQVVETGRRVRYLKPGDLVTRVGTPAVGDVHSTWGGFAEVGIATDWRAMEEDQASGWDNPSLRVQQVLPPDMDPMVAPLFITWRETLSYLTRMGVSPRRSVLVIGSGGNGLAFVSHARNLGASPVVLVGSPQRLETGRQAGATEVFDYRAPKVWDQVRSVVPDGFDFVVDAVGKASNVAEGQRCLKPGGTIGIYGLDECGTITLAPSRTFTYYGGGYDEAETHEAVLAFYRVGRLDPGVWIDRREIFPLTDLAAAFEAVRSRRLVKPLVRLAATS
jgi:L-iditol 2-dehydrogenase